MFWLWLVESVSTGGIQALTERFRVSGKIFEASSGRNYCEYTSKSDMSLSQLVVVLFDAPRRLRWFELFTHSIVFLFGCSRRPSLASLMGVASMQQKHCSKFETGVVFSECSSFALHLILSQQCHNSKSNTGSKLSV